jgi:ATP/maltotriose-dependent transcriptional regulator MalT
VFLSNAHPRTTRRASTGAQRVGELEVLTLIAQGETNAGAAARLFISEATVKTHLLHIYAKLGVNDRAAAVAAAYERGLLVPHRG